MKLPDDGTDQTVPSSGSILSAFVIKAKKSTLAI